MQILHLVFHPDLTKSKVNKVWAEQFGTSGKVATAKYMYKEYPNFHFDIEREQKDLLEHDRIVLQFPFYWYMCPPLLKKWLDDVMAYGFAYGKDAYLLEGKDVQIILSAGGDEQLYGPISVVELLRPLQYSVEYLKMNYLPPVWMYNAGSASEDAIRKCGNRWLRLIDDPNRIKVKPL